LAGQLRDRAGMGTHSVAGLEATVRNRGEDGGGRVPHSHRRRGHSHPCSRAPTSGSLQVSRRGGARVWEGSGVTLTPGPANELVFAHRARTPEATERDVPQRRPPRGKLPSDEVLLLLSSLPLPFDFLLFGFLVSSKLYVLLLVYLSLVNM
jgi:hypothetical protein